jgi:hypothetical protein
LFLLFETQSMVEEIQVIPPDINHVATGVEKEENKLLSSTTTTKEEELEIEEEVDRIEEGNKEEWQELMGKDLVMKVRTSETGRPKKRTLARRRKSFGVQHFGTNHTIT